MRAVPFRWQILGGFLALQAGVLAASLTLIHRSLSREIEEDVRSRLESSRHVFDALRSSRRRHLAAVLDLLGGDFAFKRAVATRDPGTIASAALNFRGRSGADLVWVGDPRGRWLGGSDETGARPPQPGRAGPDLGALSCVRSALGGTSASSVEVVSGRAYEMAAGPVLAPDPIAILVAGFVVDRPLAEELKRLTGSDVTFVQHPSAPQPSRTRPYATLPVEVEQQTLFDPDARRPRLLATTLPSEAWESLVEAGEVLADRAIVGAPGRRMAADRREVGAGVSVILHRPWDEALEPLRLLEQLVTAVGVAGFALTALLGFFIAAGVSDSIQSLVDRLRQANGDLTRLDAIKSKFFLTVAHDVKNPLTAVMGYLELLKERPLDSVAGRYVETAQRTSRTLDYLVSNLVDFAAMEAGKLRMVFAPADLAQIVRDIEAQMRVVADHRRIAFTVEPLPELPPLQGDARRLAQALQNLVSNALQYTRSEGSVTVRVSRLGNRVSVAVADTGIGIPPQDRARIFETFFQSEEARKLRGAGFGLGLKIVREIVEAHGGSLEVDSAPGLGSTFRMVLPLEAPEPAPAPSRADGA